MANQTVTTALNYDDASISGLLNGESITINGGSVTFNADVRWNQQAAVFGNITISTTLGGSMTVDATQVWQIPFSASTGNVPTQNALGSNGVTGGTSGATGELTRVWATGSLTPSAAGGAMPATGYIKLRSKSGTFQSGETITLPGGATVTASSAGVRSWIHVVGAQSTSFSSGRLGAFSTTGDWFELGTTNGSNNQTFQYPVADMCPAVWVETAQNSGVYEIWLNAADRWANGTMSTADKRGMFFGQNATTGVITFAATGGTVAGLLPATNCKVRIPNILCSNSSSTDWNANTIPFASSRFNFPQSTSCEFNINNISCNWNLVIYPHQITVQNSGCGDVLRVESIKGTVIFNNVGVGLVTSNGPDPVLINDCAGNVTVTDLRCVRRQSQSSSNAFSITLASSTTTLTRVRADSFGQVTTNIHQGRAFRVQQNAKVTMTDCVAVGAEGVFGNVNNNTTIVNFAHTARMVGLTTSNDLVNGLNINNSANLYVDGYGPFDSISGAHPYSSLFNIATCNGVEIRNVASAASPYNLAPTGSTACQQIIGGSTNTNIRLFRVYCTNPAGFSSLSAGNSSRNVKFQNVWANTTTPQTLTTHDAVWQGTRFAFSGITVASCVGSHWLDTFTSTTAGIIAILCNEPTLASASQCTATFASNSGWTGSNTVSMKSLTDVVEWTMPYYCLGITGFANSAPTIVGTNTANHTFTFQYDLNDGNGFNGTYLALTGANLSAITVNPNNGVKLKVKAVVNTANTGNILTNIQIATVTNSTDQTIQYLLPGSFLTVTNLVSNSRIKVTRADTGALLAQKTNGLSSSAEFELQYSGTVNVEVRNASSSPAYQPWVTQANISTSAPITVIALQITD